MVAKEQKYVVSPSAFPYSSYLHDSCESWLSLDHKMPFSNGSLSSYPNPNPVSQDQGEELINCTQEAVLYFLAL